MLWCLEVKSPKKQKSEHNEKWNATTLWTGEIWPQLYEQAETLIYGGGGNVWDVVEINWEHDKRPKSLNIRILKAGSL